MKKSFKLSVVVLFAAMIGIGQAAQFTVFNETGKPIFIQPILSDRSLTIDRLAPNESKFYETGLSSLKKLIWEEQPWTGNWEEAPISNIPSKKYEANLDVSALALGGIITIKPDGHYSFEWATLGGKGESTAREK